ncbi:MAG: hypothetical protein ACI8PZ_004016 [Myxococcota bacterium]|jgi:hypothetical protein
MRPWVPLLLLACAGPDPEQRPDEPVCVQATVVSTDPGGETMAVGVPESEVCVAVTAGSPLTLDVRWTTAEPGTSEVEFHEPGGPTWRIGDDTLTTDHAVTLYGLHADTDVTVAARSELADGSVVHAEGMVVRTGSLPPWVPEAEVLTHDKARTQPGWTLLNLSNRDADWPPTAVAYDADGRPVWFETTSDGEDSRGDLDVSLTPDGTVLVGASGSGIRAVELSWAGEVLWTGPEQSPLLHHHHAEKQADGSYVMLQHDPAPDGDATLDRIVRYAADHSVLWEWSPFDHLDLPDPLPDDWMHSNAVTITDDVVYLSCRDRDLIYGIDPHTGDVLHALGRGGDFPLRSGRWFIGQHDPELQADGSWLIYDNRGLGWSHSRVVRMGINGGWAEILWEFPGDAELNDPWYTEDWSSGIWGDADALPNGNVLVGAGSRDDGDESRVFEVTREGEVVWAIRWPDQPGIVGLYRAERIDVPLQRL